VTSLNSSDRGDFGLLQYQNLQKCTQYFQHVSLSLCVVPSVCRHVASRELSYLLDLMTLDIKTCPSRFVDSPIVNNSRPTVVQARCTVCAVLPECPVCIHALAKYLHARRIFRASSVEKTDIHIACRSVHFYSKSYRFRDN
jgi:hypothetical protein